MSTFPEEVIEKELLVVSTPPIDAVEIPDAPSVVLQTLDLARHVAIAPDGKRYVVATTDDNHIGDGYVTAVYPQQDRYLTLVRLTVYRASVVRPDDAVENHVRIVRMIQQGNLKALLKDK